MHSSGSALFFSGDRGGDIGQLKTPEIARFPEDNGLLFNHIWGKTLRDGASNLFGMRRHPNPTLCLVKAIEAYVAVSHEVGVDLKQGYLFRATSSQGHVVDKLFSSSAAESRVKVHLQAAAIDNGGTLHSFRAGSALTLAFSGSPLAAIISHVDCSHPNTASYYLKLADIIRAGAPSDRLTSNQSTVDEVSHTYTDYNSLRHFITAFPASNLPKRPFR